MKNWLLYGALILLTGLALISSQFGWQQTDSLSQQLVVKEATIDNLMVSLKQVQDKPPEVQYITIEKPPIETRIYDIKYVNKPILLLEKELDGLKTIESFDLNYLLDKIDYAIYSHAYYTFNPELGKGSPEWHWEWVTKVYLPLKDILLEIKERQ